MQPLPPHRCYVSLELPFTCTPTTTITAPLHDDAVASSATRVRRCIERYLPPRDALSCLCDDAVKDSNSGSSKHTARRGGGGAVTTATATPGNGGSHTNDGDSGTTAAVGMHQDVDINDNNNNNNNYNDGSVQDDDDDEQRAVRVHIGDAHAYTTDAVASFWRSTAGILDDTTTTRNTHNNSDKDKSDSDSDSDDSVVADGDAGVRQRLRRRREAFASAQPQLLLTAHCRNDALVRVTRRRRVRRRQRLCAVTGRLLSDDIVAYLSDDDEDNDADDNSSHTTAAAAALCADVVGVVSRHVSVSRPADLAVALPPLLLSPSDAHTHRTHTHTAASSSSTDVVYDDALPTQSCVSVDLFAPPHLLDARARFDVPYEMGKQANSSVIEHRLRQLSASSRYYGGNAAAVAAAAAADQGTTMTTIDDASFLASVVVAPDAVAADGATTTTEATTDNATTSTACVRQSAAHRAFLRHIGSSLDGSGGAGDPVEVRVLAALLRRRAVWSAAELVEAMLQSGRCPRAYHNKQLIACLTYVVAHGAYNRLRIRFGYDPYASCASVVYQRLTVRVARRSDVGVLLRDAARSPHAAAAVRVVLQRQRDRLAAYHARCAAEADGDDDSNNNNNSSGGGGGAEDDDDVRSSLPPHCTTMLELLCRIVLRGSLFVTFQLVDILDEPEVAAVVRRCVAAAKGGGGGGAMAAAQRSSPYGWLDEAAYTRLTSIFARSLARLLADDVVPLLRVFEDGGGAVADVVAAAAEGNHTRRRPRERVDDTKNDEDSSSSSSEDDDDSHASDSASDATTMTSSSDSDADGVHSPA